MLVRAVYLRGLWDFCYTLSMKMKWRTFFQYLPLLVLTFICLLPFIYNRSKAIVQTTANLLANLPFSIAYRKTDRYNPITQAIEQYPEAVLYYISDNPNSSETVTSWQRIQTTYLAYPKEVYILDHLNHAEAISRLSQNEIQAIIVSPFQQPTLKTSGVELHPHAEYYLYLINKK